MAARRCGLCGINYPSGNAYSRCPVHGEPTTFDQYISEDENWQWAATAIQLRVDGGSPDDLDGVLHLDVEIIDLDGESAIRSYDIINHGVRHRLPDGEVVAIGPSQAPDAEHPAANLWEVVGYVDSERAYWIRPLRVPDFPPADDRDGG